MGQIQEERLAAGEKLLRKARPSSIALETRALHSR